MADCEFTLPCESIISSNDNALEITNNGDGGVISATSVSSPSVAASSADGVGILGVSKSNHGVRGISSEKIRRTARTSEFNAPPPVRWATPMALCLVW